jgi:hypothetical protein
MRRPWPTLGRSAIGKKEQRIVFTEKEYFRLELISLPSCCTRLLSCSDNYVATFTIRPDKQSAMLEAPDFIPFFGDSSYIPASRACFYCGYHYDYSFPIPLKPPAIYQPQALVFSVVIITSIPFPFLSSLQV